MEQRKLKIIFRTENDCKNKKVIYTFSVYEEKDIAKDNTHNITKIFNNELYNKIGSEKIPTWVSSDKRVLDDYLKTRVNNLISILEDNKFYMQFLSINNYLIEKEFNLQGDLIIKIENGLEVEL
jgi:hypothetical protein